MRPQPLLPNFPATPARFRDRSRLIDTEGRVDVNESEMDADELSSVYAPDAQTQPQD